MVINKNKKIDLEKKVTSVLNKTAKIINPIIEELLVLNVDKKYQDIVKYSIRTGGKRLRPALAIISCQAVGGKTNDVLYPAAALEILHNYSLIIDDIIDNSALRRNKPTAWAKFGTSIAECIGIDYFASVFQGINMAKEPRKISELLAKTVKKISEGEILDILFEKEGREKEQYVVKNRYQDITTKDYFEMISKKTALLFQAACEVGGICAGANKKQIEALKNYGFNLGIAFQISDDSLDILGNKENFGKQIGQDIEKMKGGNIIVCLALEEFSSKEKKEFWQIFKKEKISQKDILKGINLIKKTKAEEKAIVYCQEFIDKAKRSLEFLPRNKSRSSLENFVNFVATREK